MQAARFLSECVSTYVLMWPVGWNVPADLVLSRDLYRMCVDDDG